MIRRPPRSTLFPYTRSSDLVDMVGKLLGRPLIVGTAGIGPTVVARSLYRHARAADVEVVRQRSEEHTSELQSRQYLVCRLLLEKKKKHNTRSQYQHSLITHL